MTKRKADESGPSHKYARHGKRAFRACQLMPGMIGFLMTCAKGREQKCYRESLQLLGDLLPPVDPASGDNAPNDPPEPQDIEQQLEAELHLLRNQSEKTMQPLKYQHTSLECMVFTQLTAKTQDPADITYRLYENVLATGKLCSRYIQRMTPVQLVCHANLASIESGVRKLKADVLPGVLKRLDGGSATPTFSVQFKRRLNEKVSRDEVIPLVAKVVGEGGGLVVDLKCPQVTVVVEVMKGVCCLAMVSDYARFKKYNLEQLVASDAASKQDEGEDKKEGQKDGDAVEDTI